MKESELGRIYKDGEVIFREGDEGDSMYVIQAGEVKITKNTPSGEVTIAVLGTGEIFGEMALFDRLPRSATAIASGEARVLSVDRKKLFSTISRDPTLVFKLIESMSKRIRRLNEELLKLRRHKKDLLAVCIDVEKVCKMILEEAREVIEADNGSIMLLDKEKNVLMLRAAFGKQAEQKVTLSPGTGIAGEVVKTGRSELVNNVSMDSRFVSGGLEIKSILCVPLRHRDISFGVINLSRFSDELFNLEDLKLLNSLALYASVAIQNALNFMCLQEVTNEFLQSAALMSF